MLEWKPDPLYAEAGFKFHVMYRYGGVETAPLFAWLDTCVGGWRISYPYIYFRREDEAVAFVLHFGD